MARLLVENQKLQFWLNRYKAIKDKYLARGSFQERLTKWAAKKLIHRRAANLSRFSDQRGKAGSVSTAYVDGIVEPPQHWEDNPLRPPIVIAILNWNRVELLRKCLESLFLYTDYERLSICVYDQGSTDGSPEYLQSLGGRVDAVLGNENLGFITANNLIIERYAKWDVIFLNNDTQVTERWLEPLLETSYKSEKIGIVGPNLSVFMASFKRLAAKFSKMAPVGHMASTRIRVVPSSISFGKWITAPPHASMSSEERWI